MADKMTCPGCNSHTSAVMEAVRRDEPCPNCGLSADAILEVDALRKRRDDDELTARLSEALVRAGKAEAEVARLQAVVDAVRVALNGSIPAD